MLQCALDDVTPGMILGSTLLDPQRPQHELLRPGVALDAGLLASLRQRGVTRVWVEDDLTKDLDAAVAPTLTASRMQVYGALREGLGAASRGTISTASIREYRAAVLSLVVESVAAAPYASMTDALFGAPGLAAHGTNVAYLSLLCGLQINRYVAAEQSRLPPKEAREVSVLGIAGLLHDIGKCRGVPRVAGFHDIDARESGGGQDRPAGYAEHVTLGRMMLEDSRAPARVAYTVLHHHQRFDGTGWPVPAASADRARPRFAGRAIHIFARIVSAANVLDGLLRDAAGGQRPPVAALHAFASARFDGWFDPVVRRAMLLRVPAYAIGTHVTLSDGRRAVVVGLNEEDPCRPVVRLHPHGGGRGAGRREATAEVVDLSDAPGVRITHALGVDVAGYEYEAPPVVAPAAAEEAAANGGDGAGGEGSAPRAA